MVTSEGSFAAGRNKGRWAQGKMRVAESSSSLALVLSCRTCVLSSTTNWIEVEEKFDDRQTDKQTEKPVTHTHNLAETTQSLQTVPVDGWSSVQSWYQNQFISWPAQSGLKVRKVNHITCISESGIYSGLRIFFWVAIWQVHQKICIEISVNNSNRVLWNRRVSTYWKRESFISVLGDSDLNLRSIKVWPSTTTV